MTSDLVILMVNCVEQVLSQTQKNVSEPQTEIESETCWIQRENAPTIELPGLRCQGNE